MKSSLKSILILAAVIVLAPLVLAGDKTTGSQPTVQSILARYADALGGVVAIHKITARSCTGREVTDLTSREQPIYQSLPFEAHSKAPMNWSYEVWSDEGGHRDGFDGEVGWTKDRCGVQTDQRLSHSKLAFLLNPQGALHADHYFPDLTYAGETEMNGVDVLALKPDSLPPDHYTLYFSKESGLLVGIGYYWTVEDYRKVDGVMCPHRIAASRKGGSTTYELMSVTHNAEISDSIFATPNEAD